MKQIIVATNNRNKLEEFRDIFRSNQINVISLKDAGISVDPDENGKTIEENARIKAKAVWEICHSPVLADDTGLFVDALDGEPGVHAARYAGDPQDSERNIDKLLNKLGDLPREKRSARFITAICFIDENGGEKIVHGVCEGWIAFERLGTGFGYEPVFCINNGFTLAQIGREAKDRRSHRARAAHKLGFYLRNIRKIRRSK